MRSEMIRRARRATLLACLGMGCSAGIARAQGLRAVPLDDPRMPLLEALLLRRPDLSRVVWLADRPWREAEIDSLVAAAARGPLTGLETAWLERIEAASGGGEDEDVSVYNRVGAEFQGFWSTRNASFDPPFRAPAFDADSGRPATRFIARHDFAADWKGRLALAWRYVVDSEIRNDPTRRTRFGIRGSEAAFEVLDGYATVAAGPIQVTVGRLQRSLGPGRGSTLVLSDSIPALDQVRLDLGGDRLRFTAMVAQLSRERPNRALDENGDAIPGSRPADGEPVALDVSRTLYLHRLDWRPRDDLQLALTEASLVTGVDRGVEFRYLNPLLPFYATQEERDESDVADVNLVADLQGIYSGPGASRLYADLFVQELFLDAAKRRRIGNQLAWRLGGEWADPFEVQGVTVGGEYTRVDVFTYLHRGLNTNWTTFGVPLGSSLGPDADQAQVWLERWIRPTARVSLEGLLRREGERDVRTLESVTTAGNPSFPSGVVQREWRLGVEAWATGADGNLEGRLRVGRRGVRNVAHEPGRDDAFWDAALSVSYFYRFR